MRERTPRSSALTRVSRTVERIARALFARSDARAGTRGWDVAVTGRWGTSASYHDPRYDRLDPCVGCAGEDCRGAPGRAASSAAPPGAHG